MRLCVSLRHTPLTQTVGQILCKGCRMIKKDEWFLSLSPEQQSALVVSDSYAKKCPYCSHNYICEIDDGEDCFHLGRRYWVHYCEMDDNLHSEEISHCPYCGNRLPSFNEVDFHAVWTSQSKIEINLSELQYIPNTEFSRLLKLPSIGIRRTISLPDFIKIFGTSRPTPPIDLEIKDFKASIISEDVRKLVDMGYTKVYMIELAPGDTSVSYILQGVVE